MTTPARKKWFTANRERLNAQARERYAQDIEKAAALRAKKREAANAYAAAYREKNKRKIKKSMDAYYAANKEKWKGYAARKQVKMDADPEYARRQVESVRRGYLKRTYGLDPEKYEEMVMTNNGVCAICLGPSGRRRLAIDHDHKTGKVRGLLCATCNRAIGLFADSPEILDRAAAYLRKHNG